MRFMRAFFASLSLVVLALAPVVSAQTGSSPTGDRIASTAAFSAGCSSAELSGITVKLDLGWGLVDLGNAPSPVRTDPEWAVIITDPGKSIMDQPPQLVEGVVTTPDFAPGSASPGNATSDYQADAEVAEEDLGWTHYTHDYTFKLTPDPAYQKVLSYYIKTDLTYGFQPDMEVEWDNASMMDEHEGFQRIWGAVPEFVWPSYGDRIWVLGQWIFDCGHPGSNTLPNVKFETEIHPPRALVTQRLYHTALDSFPRQRISEPSYPEPQSYLPVTGEPESGVTTFPTWVPLTEADIFVSGNGGGARDLCSVEGASPAYTDVRSVLDSGSDGYTHCGDGHTNPVSPVNDRNYVFDIYPPVTDYEAPDTSGGASTTINGHQVYPFTVIPPTADASLQYRIVDHDSEIPTHTCGTNSAGDCTTVDPIICLIDNTTPPPDQSETSCPAVPARPTRLRVILPFKGTSANYFAKSILVGWDDVPSPDDDVARVRTFKIKLHSFHINENGSGPTSDGDWRLFLNVNGQWRYMSPYFDTDNGINVPDGGDNVCSGTALTENGDDDCFHFDNTPFIVNITHEEPIYIGVGGFIARDVENAGEAAAMCRNFPGGCDPRITLGGFVDLATSNDDRIGTQEWRLRYLSEYAAPNPESSTVSFGCSILTPFGCNIQYSTTFTVEEIAASTPPSSGDPTIGKPNYVGTNGTFITSATPLTLTPTSAATNFQYRFHLQGGALPTFASGLSFPVHWTSADLGGASSVDVYLNSGGGAAGDGPYDFQYSAEQDYHLLETRHTKTLILDNTPPVTTFVQPAAGATYGHSDVLTLNYPVSDGTGSGVDSSTINPKMDGQTSAQFMASLAPNAMIYLESMTLGTHTFSVDAADNLGNAGTGSATFTITVTFDSLKGDVTNLPPGCITNIGQSLVSKFGAAQNVYGKGQIQTAINILSAALYEVQAQAGKHISTTCQDPTGRTFNPVNLLEGDIQYLQGILAGQLKPDPVMGFVTSSAGLPIYGATVNLVASKTIIATAVTDAAGFYYFADVSGLVPGAGYMVTVTIPKGLKTSSPTSVNFKWSSSAVVGNFLLN